MVMGLTISAAPLLGIPFDPGNEYLLLLPIALGLSIWKETSRKNLFLWASALGMIFFGLWILFLITLGRGTQPVQNPIMLFPLPVILLVWLGFLFFKKKRTGFVE